jgi:hypothetical protein
MKFGWNAITQATERHGTKPAICMWISSMLKSRNIIITLLGETMRVSKEMCTLTSAVKRGHRWASLGAK